MITAARAAELDEPKNFIRQALRTIRAGKATGTKRSRTALKAIGLLLAASLRAQAIGRWSKDAAYDPVPDLRRLHAAASAGLGPMRSATPDHPVTLFRENIEATIADLEKPE